MLHPKRPAAAPRRADAVTGPGRAGPPRALLTLARGAASGRRVRVAYRDAPGEVTEREVEVLSLGFRWGGWVAACHCLRRDALRLLAVERVQGARLGRRRAAARSFPGFDPEAFAAEELLDPEAGPLLEVTVRLPAPLAPLATTLFAGGAVEPVRGGARVRLRVTSGAVLRAMVASLGARAAP